MGVLGQLHRRLPFAALGAIAMTVGLSSSALGSSNSIKLVTPKHVRVSTVGHIHKYTVTAKGFAVTKEQLFLFIDFAPCATNPTTEAQHDGTTGFGEPPWRVHGKFTKAARGLYAGVMGQDHACAYLVNSTTGTVLAHRFATFTVS